MMLSYWVKGSCAAARRSWSLMGVPTTMTASGSFARMTGMTFSAYARISGQVVAPLGSLQIS